MVPVLARPTTPLTMDLRLDVEEVQVRIGRSVAVVRSAIATKT